MLAGIKNFEIIIRCWFTSDTSEFTSDNNFKILDSCQPFDLRILESIYIHKIKPSLNDHASSVELSILK